MYSQKTINGLNLLRRYNDSITNTHDEYLFLKFIRNNSNSLLTPNIYQYTQEYIDFEYISGISLNEIISYI
jgi:predicted Ser/Thr protein kinase